MTTFWSDDIDAMMMADERAMTTQPITRTIPPPLYLNGYAAMEFVHMLEQLREMEGFDPHKGLRITVEQEDE